jgi:potassium-dependent mechanosensitive channel
MTLAVPALRVQLGFVAALLLASAGTFGQAPTIPELSRARDAVARKKSITEIERRQILELYDQSIKSVEAGLRFQALQLGQERSRVAIGRELAALEEEVRRPVSAPSAPQRADETAREVEEALAQTLTEREARQKAISDLSRVGSDLAKRQDEINQRRAELRQKLENADDQLAVVQLTSVSPDWETAARSQLLTLKQTLTAEMESLRAERETLELRRALVPLQRESARLRLEAAERYMVELKERAKAAQKRDAAREVEQAVKAAREAETAFPDLGPVAREVAELVPRLWGPNGALAASQEIAEASAWMRERSDRVEKSAAVLKRRYRTAGPFAPANEWLDPLPKGISLPVEIQRTRLRRLWLLPQVRRDILALEEQRSGETTLETQVQQLKSSASKVAPADLARFESQARALLQLRRNLTEDLLRANQALEGQLAEFDNVSADLLRRLHDAIEFVWARILWTRSTTMGPALTPAILADGAQWFILNPDWGLIARGPFRSKTAAIWTILAFLLVILLFAGRPRFRNALQQVSAGLRAQPARGSRALCSSLFYTALISAGPPAAVWWIYLIVGVEDSAQLSRAVAAGLLYASILLYLLLFTRTSLADGGLAEGQFGMPGAARAALTKELRWLIPVLPSFWFFVKGLHEVGGLVYEELHLQVLSNSVGRACFIAALLCALVACRRVLHPKGPLVEAYGFRPGRPRRSRQKLLSRALISLVIAALVFLAVAGFFMTSLMLTQNLAATGLLTAGLALCSTLFTRWRHEQAAGISPTVAGAAARDVESAHSQVLQLTKFVLTMAWIVGALLIWARALPALTLLRQVQVLPVVRIVESEELASLERQAPKAPLAQDQAARPPDASAPAAATVPQPPAQPGTTPKTPDASKALFLFDILKAILVGILAVIFVKDLPGLLEFLVFRRFDLDAGAKYAINTIARYSVTILGVIAVSGILGISWSQVQWLAAAMTFGIGFGLQEIFANFASGLILLLDRSLRVGDAVSVGELSGRVSRIQMRATTITLWDRSEMIVPNKEFVTGKLVNWTLSFPESRVDVKVGVAYDSDIDLVRRVLLEVAHANPNVLKVPPPEVLLMEFADSAVLLELRVFGLYEYGRLVLLNELHTAVFREFRKHGIVIAFPQLDVRLNPEKKKAAGSSSQVASV